MSSPLRPTESSAFALCNSRTHRNEDDSRILANLQCVTTKNVSISHIKADPPPCHPASIGSSNARRLMKRATLCKMEHDDPIFIMHDEKAGVGRTSNHLHATPFADAMPSYCLSSSPPSKIIGITTDLPSAPTVRYSVQCYAAHAEAEEKKREAELVWREKRALIDSINVSRRAEGVCRLYQSPHLHEAAQATADALMLEDHLSGMQPLESSPSTSSDTTLVGLSAPLSQSDPSPLLSQLPPLPPSENVAACSARLESPPGMGALAAAEMWYGGKYRRHSCAIDCRHRPDCAWSMRRAFETLVDARWTAVGVGWSADMRWVVELGADNVSAGEDMVHG